MSTLLITGGRVLDPASGFDETADVLLRDGVVAAIERTPGALSAEEAEILDAEGCLVCPGLIDPHVHFREPGGEHKETIATGTASALNGGFTTVCCMPNTTPALDTAAQVELIDLKAQRLQRCRLYVVAAATEGRAGERLAPIESMALAGAVGISDDGDVVASAGMMRKVLQTCRSADRVFMQHCQEPTLTRGGVMNAGALATRLGLGGWPRLAEELIIERDVRLNRDVGCAYHVQHLSSGGSVDLVREARRRGEPVSAEASPHHLLLTEEACAAYDTNAKMNPPLRAAQDIDGIKAGIADATITVLATDHAPHGSHEKALDFASAPFGIVGLDCALPLYRRALIDDGVIDWPRMIAMMTIEPARLVGLDRIGLGSLTVGGPADVTVIDPELEWTIRSEEFASMGRNCPFEGWQVRGRSTATIVGGVVRHRRSASDGADATVAHAPAPMG